MNLPTKQATAPDAAPYQDLLQTLATSAVTLQTLHHQAVEALAPTVQEILRSGSRDAQRIEHTLDQLLNHACTPEGLVLFKTLCRHYWAIDPQATASYVHAYREMWDGDDQNDTEEVKA
jgi:hypothetical protein